MEKVKIRGIGLVNRAGILADTLWESLCNGKVTGEVLPVTEFKPEYPSSKLRRMNRYCKMALYAAQKAWKDGGVYEETDPLMRGTIFATGYGAMSAHVKFCRETAKGEPDFCSPTVFTGIVPNSCVGTVCMFLQCKGYSTVLSGGNQLEYSQLLLEDGRAQMILCGAVEEYTQELFCGLESRPELSGKYLAEGCAVLALDKKEKPGYCTLERTETTGLTGFSMLSKIDSKENEERIAALLEEFVPNKPDVVFLSGNGSYFDEIEQKAFASCFAETPKVSDLKKITGETLGCGFTMQVAAAALCLKHGCIPAALCHGNEIPVERILVCGFDPVGNYMCALLSR